jgi:hypothetical protein
LDALFGQLKHSTLCHYFVVSFSFVAGYPLNWCGLLLSVEPSEAALAVLHGASHFLTHHGESYFLTHAFGLGLVRLESGNALTETSLCKATANQESIGS